MALFRSSTAGEGQQVDLVALTMLFVHRVSDPEGFVVGMGKDVENAHWDRKNRSLV